MARALPGREVSLFVEGMNQSFVVIFVRGTGPEFACEEFLPPKKSFGKSFSARIFTLFPP
jgi:hypothetical protein